MIHPFEGGGRHGATRGFGRWRVSLQKQANLQVILHKEGYRALYSGGLRAAPDGSAR